ncbi:MAG: hypothetical protein HYT94_02215 [Parcubacteria group bacterium]|nr:hypothetical protein [Parcubacteria group bacterium]
MSPLPLSFSTITLTKSTVWMFFALILAIWMIATLVIEYHWKSYATDTKKISSMRFAYRIGSYFLLAIIFLAALFY